MENSSTIFNSLIQVWINFHPQQDQEPGISLVEPNLEITPFGFFIRENGSEHFIPFKSIESCSIGKKKEKILINGKGADKEYSILHIDMLNYKFTIGDVNIQEDCVCIKLLNSGLLDKNCFWHFTKEDERRKALRILISAFFPHIQGITKARQSSSDVERELNLIKPAE